MFSFHDEVLHVFVEYADREMRAGDVRQLMEDRGRKYASNGHISVMCAKLHREGLLFRLQDKQGAWYCVARAHK
jgi:hypothetical protein